MKTDPVLLRSQKLVKLLEQVGEALTGLQEEVVELPYKHAAVHIARCKEAEIHINKTWNLMRGCVDLRSKQISPEESSDVTNS